ncbi:MAG: NAD(P)/FAD-dependent oxidoreductase [Acidobacteria bacterium]|nr:MAG: NAD(P)/FAD-dependent oxidoreductase [Acidobacteriota bacterium]
MYDVIIVGAGPAGLSAALVLGRCRRRVLVCDSGRPRNAASQALHGYLTRDGIAPVELLRIGRDQLRQYDTIDWQDAEVVEAECRPDRRFRVALTDGREFASRKLLIATGVVDSLPEIDGFRDLFGRSVFHCPYCDGWELRDEPLAVYGRGARGLGLSLELIGWSRDIVLCTDGPPEIDADGRERLARNGIAVRQDRVDRLEGRDSRLALRLGCEFNEKGTVRTGKYEATHLPGLYVAGDASRAVQWVVVAAAEGAEAAFAINTDLLREDLK